MTKNWYVNLTGGLGFLAIGAGLFLWAGLGVALFVCGVIMLVVALAAIFLG